MFPLSYVLIFLHVIQSPYSHPTSGPRLLRHPLPRFLLFLLGPLSPPIGLALYRCTTSAITPPMRPLLPPLVDDLREAPTWLLVLSSV